MAAPFNNQQTPESWGQWASRFALGSPARTEKLSKYTPEIQGQLDQNILQLLQGTGPSSMQQQTNKQLQNEVIPNIANRFLGKGNRNSSDFQAQLGSSASDTLQGNQMQQLMSLLQAGGQDTNYFPAESGLAQQILPAAVELGKAYLNPVGTGADWLNSLLGGSAQQPNQQQGPSPVEQQLQPMAQSVSSNSQDAILQKIIDSLLFKNTPGAQQNTEFNLPQERNPKAFRLGGTGYTADQQQSSAMNFLRNLISKNNPSFSNLR